jgi:hypothetical protein
MVSPPTVIAFPKLSLATKVTVIEEPDATVEAETDTTD